MLGMARRKKTGRPKPAAPNRSGVPLYVYVPVELGDALQRYLDGTSPRVSKTSAVEAAIQAFLREKGHWPPPPDPK